MALSADGLPDKTLLIVDDDAPFRQRLARAMEARGFLVTAAETAEEAISLARKTPPAFAVVDLRLGQSGNGLDVIEVLHQARPDARVVMLTGSSEARDDARESARARAACSGCRHSDTHTSSRRRRAAAALTRVDLRPATKDVSDR